jgi:restriction system protein
MKRRAGCKDTATRYLVIALLLSLVLIVGWPWIVGWPLWAEWLASALWWSTLAAVIGGTVVAVVRRSRARREQLRSLGLPEIDRMTGQQFEQYAAAALRGFGYRVRHMGRSGDFGGDLLVIGHNRRMVVQCKRYGRPVGLKAIQEAHAARSHYRVPEAAVLTNSTFTPAAKRLARETGVQCWDRSELQRLLVRARDSRTRDSLADTDVAGHERARQSPQRLANSATQGSVPSVVMGTTIPLNGNCDGSEAQYCVTPASAEVIPRVPGAEGL